MNNNNNNHCMGCEWFFTVLNCCSATTAIDTMIERGYRCGRMDMPISDPMKSACDYFMERNHYDGR